MLISIVTPVRNGMPWLPECVSSVAGQRPEVDVEHLVLDGGSSDGSREWLREHETGSYVAILEPDSGQTDALIRGFERAEGDVLGWLNADDRLEPGALARVRDAFDAHPDAIVVTAAALLIDPAGRVIGTINPPRDPSLSGLLRDPTNPPQPATFFRATAYRQVGGLDRDLNLAMDLDLWLRLATLGLIVALPDQVLARFRLHPAAKSVAGAAAAAREDLRIRRRHGTALRSPAGLALIRAGFLRPVLGPPKRAVTQLLHWVFAGPGPSRA